MQKVKIFRCPGCSKTFNTLKLWEKHLTSKHPEMIPDGWPAARYFYYLQTGKKTGSCVECKGPTDWNDATCKYNRFCNKPECKAKYRDRFKSRMIGKYGKVTLLDDPEQQRKMIMGRRNSGYYDFPDGKIGYSSSYELDFLKMCDKFLHMQAQDIIQPSPHTYYYDYRNPDDRENEGRKFYIPDFFIPSLNLEIEIKQNTSTHPKIIRIDKVKEQEKDAMMDTIRGINYIKIVDMDYREFFKLISELRSMIPDKPKEVALEAVTISKSKSLLDDALKLDTPEKLLAWMMQHIRYANFTKLLSPKELCEKRAGSCHDQSLFISRILSRYWKGISTWFFIETNNKGGGGTTHSFVTYRDGEKICWIETAWGGHQGIRTFSTPKEIRDYIKEEHANHGWGNIAAYPNVVFGKLHNLRPGMTLSDIVDAALPTNEKATESMFANADDYSDQGYISLSEFNAEPLNETHTVNIPELKHVRYDRGCNGEIFYKNGAPVCYYMLRPDYTKPGWWITALEVLPNFRGNHLTTQLLTRIKHKHGRHDPIRLSVNKKNTLAYQIYLKFGFRVFKETESMRFMEIH